jgi:hypothetical protein
MTGVLKELATDIAPILTIIFQISLESGVVPSDWKTAHVAPVYPRFNFIWAGCFVWIQV